MKRITRHGTMILGVLATVAVASGEERTNHHAYYEAKPLVAGATKNTAAGRHGVIASRDEIRGVPTVFWADPGRTARAPRGTPAKAARWYLTNHAGLYGLSRAALDTVQLHRVHDIGRGGIIAIFRQRIDGLDVARNELKVLMTRDLRLLAITGNLHPAATGAAVRKSGGFRLGADEALSLALGDLYGVELSVAGIRDLRRQQGGYQHFDLALGSAALQAGIRLAMPARVKAAYFPLPDKLVPAYFVELLASRHGEPDEQGYAYFVAADDGRVLYRNDRIIEEAHHYRVWADTVFPHTPADNPQADYSPHPAGIPDGTEPLFVPPVSISMDGFSTNPERSPDPWLPAGAMETSGNNVDAYADHVDPNGFTAGDLRAHVTAPDIFDQVFDTGAHPLSSPEQIQAAVVQLFYTTNWLHDYFYDAGFDEAAGNAQNDNFGRCQGCLGGDALLAEAQDLGPDATVRNNANMFVPADGMPPRMQMYLWSVPDLSRSLTAADRSFDSGIATFGPQRFTRSAPLILADDGVGIRTDGCESMKNDVSGAIVLIDRGTCAFPVKVRNAEQGGALGVIIAHNQANEPPPRLDGTNPPIVVDIPALSITREDGQFLKARLAAGSVQAQMAREAGIERDGTIDNTIVAHEWGHYLHVRLVECTTQQCRAQSEGWADFMALLMMVREGDDLDGTYAVGGYATLTLGANSSYFGIRRAPYSRDLDKNALSFRHIADGAALPTNHPLRPSPNESSEVHNAGEIWAAMLFDGYLGLLASERHSFEETRQRMAEYVVAGMILAPADPTFTEQRDALLLAALARDPQDALVLAEGFARRGAGSCAVSPARSSRNLTGVIEDLAARPRVHLRAVTIDDSAISCDADGALDVEESGVLRIVVENPTVVPLRSLTGTVSVASSRLSFPQGTAVELDELAPFASTTIELPVKLDAAVDGAELVEVMVSLTNAQACEPTVNQVIYEHVDFDLAAATVDTVESRRIVWQEVILDDGPPGVWTPGPSRFDPRDRVWHGTNDDFARDALLVSPPLRVPADQALMVVLEHRHEFESAEDPDTGMVRMWDGAVIEVSLDGGQSWDDVSVYADPGYNGIIDEDSFSELYGRPGFVGKNPSWPGSDTVSLDFGTRLSGHDDVRLRFRIATDNVSGAPGWEIDDITVHGIANQPFWSIGDDASTCTVGGLPVADAGPDQTVMGGAVVTLDASASTDPDGDVLSYQWSQDGVPAVVLSGSDMARPVFTAPMVEEDTVLVFEARVSDGSGADTDTVEITVLASPPDGGDSDGGMPGADGGLDGGDQMPKASGSGCGCTIGAAPSRPSWLLALLVGFGVVAMRRRRH